MSHFLVTDNLNGEQGEGEPLCAKCSHKHQLRNTKGQRKACWGRTDLRDLPSMTEISPGVEEEGSQMGLWGSGDSHSRCLQEEGFPGVFEEHLGRCGRKKAVSEARGPHVGASWPCPFP